MHLFALIPGQGASQLLRQLADVLGKRSNNSRRVLAGDLDEHREAGIALDEGSDVRVVRSGKKVSFPMPRHSAILNLGGPLADRDHIEDMPLSTLRVVALGVTHPPRSTQLRRQLLFQHAAGLDEEAAIDRFREISACLGGLGTPASASRRSAAATIAARASAPRAIVAPYAAPNDKAWGATPAPRHADQPGLHDRPDCRRCAGSPGLLSMALVRGSGRSAGSTGQPQCHGNLFAFLKPECRKGSSALPPAA